MQGYHLRSREWLSRAEKAVFKTILHIPINEQRGARERDHVLHLLQRERQLRWQWLVPLTRHLEDTFRTPALL